MDVLLAQRERVFLRDADDDGPALRVPVLASQHFVLGPDGVEVSLEARHGGKVIFRGRLLTHWIVGGEDCPVTFREEQGDLVLDEVVRGGRVAVRTFFANGAGVLLLLGVTLPVGARHETDNEMAEALGTHRSGLDLTVGARGP